MNHQSANRKTTKIKATYRLLRALLAALALICLLFLFWWGSKTPSNEGDWQTAVRVLPTVQLEGDVVRIQNVRDFRYNTDDSIAEVRYVDRQYRLSEFRQAWYGISHFGDNGLAHVFMSFEFAGDQFLVVSIEARLQNKHVDGYHPLRGLFRGYTKTIVLATEQDVIGLRSHIRKERVLLHRLQVPELYTKPLLLNFLREAQVLTRKPTFYNTLIDNCMTGLLAQTDQYRGMRTWLDKRIFLPGNSDEITYELGYIENSKPLAEVRAAALVDPTLTSIEDANFSLKIRRINHD